MPEHAMSSDLSIGVGEYLEAVYKLTLDSGRAQVPALAERMKVTPTSANEMVRRLSRRGLVNYERYKGVTLTGEGKRQAIAVIRRHRLWERFLVDYLGMPWDVVHEEACRLEHATSEAVEERLAAFLDAPATCPHGYAMPTAEGELTESPAPTIGDLSPGDEAVVVRVPEDDPALLRYLAELGLRPGNRLEVVSVEPFDGPLSLRVEGGTHVIAKSLAASIAVQRRGGQE